jgi:hypothetical protein
MYRIVSFIALFSIVAVTPTTNAFSCRSTSKTTTNTAIRQSAQDNQNENITPIYERRSFLRNFALSLPIAATLPLAATRANASGGATAGGAYLLSAKQRYNERVRASVNGLLSAADALKSGDSKPAKEYFANEDGGSWKDLTSAGYLLSNAFRRNSSAAPDSLPSVKVCLLTICVFSGIT